MLLLKWSMRDTGLSGDVVHHETFDGCLGTLMSCLP